MALADLAQRSGTDPDALKRILRLLMSAGIFSVDEQDRCALTPRAEFLRRDNPESIASEVELFAGAETYLAWSELLQCARTGQTGFGQFFGKSLFDYLAEHPDSAQRFHLAGTRSRSAPVSRPRKRSISRTIGTSSMSAVATAS